MLLCADIGGTKTTLALIGADGPRHLLRLERHASPAVRDLRAAMTKLLAGAPGTLDAVCLGVAGPVVGTRVETTNLPWLIDATALGEALGVPVFLLNDLEALAYGIPALDAEGLATLNAASPEPHGAIAVIAAGTGLGEAGLVWDGRAYLAVASEGGHTDFAPRSDREIALLRHGRARWDHVSWEHLVSGPGIVHILDFLRDVEGHALPAPLAAAMAAGDPSAAITSAALSGEPPIAVAALDLFAVLYGAEAGNLALKLKATGGAYVGGGIAPKILPKLREGSFREAFVAKGRFRNLLESIPVHVILDEHTALYGAARYAAARVRV